MRSPWLGRSPEHQTVHSTLQGQAIQAEPREVDNIAFRSPYTLLAEPLSASTDADQCRRGMKQDQEDEREKNLQHGETKKNGSRGGSF